MNAASCLRLSGRKPAVAYNIIKASHRSYIRGRPFCSDLCFKQSDLEVTASLAARAISRRFLARIRSATSVATGGPTRVISLRLTFFGGRNALVAHEDAPLSFKD